MSLPDIQNNEPNIKIPIKQVGVENVEVPFYLESKYGGFFQLIANVSMRVDLNSETKGISMSRLLLTLQPYLNKPLKWNLIKEILKDLKKNLNSETSFLKFEFKLPINRKSPISDNEFPVFYKCKFEGQLVKERVYEQGQVEYDIDSFRFYQGVRVQYSSYCPCSAELCKDLESKNLHGYPHNQRSYADILIESKINSYVWLEDIIELVESQIKTLPYPIIKRTDEQEIAKIAYKNPMFVEDAIRIISLELNKKFEIYDWAVKVVHEESIHTSEAVALNWKGVPNGFTSKIFL